MISVEQANEIIKRTGKHNYIISKKMGKSTKYLLAQLCLYRQNNQPFSPRLARMFLKAVGEKNYRDIVSRELIELCQHDYFLSKEQFQKLLNKLRCTHPMLAKSLGMNSKGFYMVLIQSDGLNYRTTKMLFEKFPLEMSRVLTKIQLEIIFDYL